MFRTLLIILLILFVHTHTGSALASEIDLSKSVIIGTGPKKVIEFTDPDCPFCRKAATYFHNRHDITRYVFFVPLPMHPHARKKVQFILSNTDKPKLYQEVMSGSLDRLDSRHLPVSQSGIKLQEEQQAVAKKAGVDSTPTFMIMGRIIEGFDVPKIEALLGK